MSRVVGTGSAVDLAINRLARLSIAYDTTPHQMARETRIVLASWQDLPGRRRNVARLRVMLITGLANAEERLDNAGVLEWRYAQGLVEVLRAAEAAVNKWLEELAAG